MIRTKPPAGTQINWGHPLSSGLVAAFLFNEHGPATKAHSGGFLLGVKYLYESVTGINGAALNNSSCLWTPTPHGMSLRWAAANADFTFPARYQPMNVWSTEFFVMKGSFGTHAVWGTATNGIQMIINGSGQLWVLKTGAVDMGTSTGTLTAGRYHHCGVSYDGATLRFYIDGKPAGTASSAQTFSHGRLQVGDDGNSAFALNDANMLSLYIWKRVLSAADFQTLAIDPYPFMVQPA
jgi:hypothetical protein